MGISDELAKRSVFSVGKHLWQLAGVGRLAEMASWGRGMVRVEGGDSLPPEKVRPTRTGTGMVSGHVSYIVHF